VRPQVGIAKAERALTAASVSKGLDLLRPGRGRVLVIIDEADLGLGRPDVVLLAVSMARLRWKASHGLRLVNRVEASVLAGTVQGSRSFAAITPKRTRELRMKLAARGWLGPVSPRIDAVAIEDNLLVEAKVRDWRTGLIQLARARRYFRKAALLMPAEALVHVPRAYLAAYRLGLVAYDPPGGVRWVRRSPITVQNLSALLWLDELAIRHVVDGAILSSLIPTA
jgi:hypothetical protein